MSASPSSFPAVYPRGVRALVWLALRARRAWGWARDPGKAQLTAAAALVLALALTPDFLDAYAKAAERPVRDAHRTAELVARRVRRARRRRTDAIRPAEHGSLRAAEDSGDCSGAVAALAPPASPR